MIVVVCSCCHLGASEIKRKNDKKSLQKIQRIRKKQKKKKMIKLNVFYLVSLENENIFLIKK